MGPPSPGTAFPPVGFYNGRLYLGRSAGSTHGVAQFDTPGLLTTSGNSTTLLTGDGWNHNSGSYLDFAFLGENFLFTTTRSLNAIQVFRNDDPDDTTGWDLYSTVDIGTNAQRMSLLETGDGNAQIFFNVNESATDSRLLGTVPWTWNETTELWEFGDVEILLDLGEEDRWFQGVAATAIIPEPASFLFFAIALGGIPVVWRHVRRA